jgi:hypothetical protein
VVQRDDERARGDGHETCDGEAGPTHRAEGLEGSPAVEERDEAEQREEREQRSAGELRRSVDRERPLQQAGRRPGEGRQGDEELTPAVGVHLVGRPRHRRQSSTVPVTYGVPWTWTFFGSATMSSFVAHASTEAFVSGLNGILLVAAAIAFAGSVLSFVLVRPRDFRAHEHVPEEPALELAA